VRYGIAAHHVFCRAAPVAFAITAARSDNVLPLQRDGLELNANWNRTQ
jgi:hypothetical protein